MIIKRLSTIVSREHFVWRFLSRKLLLTEHEIKHGKIALILPVPQNVSIGFARIYVLCLKLVYEVS